MTWYKDAVFYEVHVKAFMDGDGNGVGDFVGLTSKLDYVRELGVDCLWILPMYPSPLRDDGYDISDFYGIHPSYGTVEDFQKFLDAAHDRGLRVIADLVMNHTSDQHPWFQSARSDPASPFRDYYVWSDTDQRYREARIIFTDTEKSNWTWDATAKRYYWHRFFSHQPDLNYANPAVLVRMVEVILGYVRRGATLLRMDAVGYLWKEIGTSCIHLPQTHQIVKLFRDVLDDVAPEVAIVTETNVPHADNISYFGDGHDEAQMVYQFPLAPLVLHALATGDASRLSGWAACWVVI